MSVCVLPGSSARHLCGWKSKEEENVCLFERKRLRRKFKKKRIWTDGSRPAFCFCFCFTLEDEIKFRAFFYLPRERERLFVCVQLYQTCRASPSSLSKLNLLTVHIEHAQLIKLDCCFFFVFSAAGPVPARPPFEKRKTKKEKVCDNSKSIRAEYIQGRWENQWAAIRFDPAWTRPSDTQRESCSCTLPLCV
jgi:hypothetical protein